MTAKRDIYDAKHTIARWKNLSSTYKNEKETKNNVERYL